MWNFNLIFILVESVFSLYVQQKSVFLRVCAFSSRNTLCRHSEAKKKKTHNRSSHDLYREQSQVIEWRHFNNPSYKHQVHEFTGLTNI